jgi:hypothetical protein
MGNEMAGYSGTPLVKKLGIGDDSTIVAIDAPANYAKLLAPLPMGAKNITEDVIREVAPPMGFVDVKVCAVDDTWSGLKLVIRRELRS